MHSMNNNGRKLRRAVIAVGLAATLFTTAAQAAMLANLEGSVSVNRGDGFQPVSAGTTVAPGDRIKTGKGSTVNVVYENGYSVPVGPNQVRTVQYAPAPVAGAASAAAETASAGGSALAGLGGGALGGIAAPVVVGGVVAGAVTVGVVASSNNNKDSVSGNGGGSVSP
jgi:hypothetical protein